MKKGQATRVLVSFAILGGIAGLVYAGRKLRATAGDDELETPEDVRRRLIGEVLPEDARAALMAAEPTPHYFYPAGRGAEINPEWSDWFESLGPLSDQEFYQVWDMTREESFAMQIPAGLV